MLAKNAMNVSIISVFDRIRYKSSIRMGCSTTFKSVGTKITVRHNIGVIINGRYKDRGSGRTDRCDKTVDIEITRGVRYGKNRKYPMGEDQGQKGQGSTGRAQQCGIQATRSGPALLICGYKEKADKAI